MKVCAFTGHRKNLKDLDINLLDRVIENLIISGVDSFLCGMAEGFDLIAAESVISLKDRYPVTLTACIPCENQTDTFSAANRHRYENIIKKCDKKIVLAEEYFSGCMQARDRFLVDNCDVLVSYLRTSRGGTFYTVNYAKKQDKKIIEL